MSVAQITACDQYLAGRTGKYEWREVRYRHALAALERHGLGHDDTVIDVGAGWTEFDYCLRTVGGSRCRYYPVDGCLDGVDLETWQPPRRAEFFVALELLEHLRYPSDLVYAMQDACSKALVVSTPNPETTDVLGMDRTHRTPITTAMLGAWGFRFVEPVSFYGQPNDSLFAVWTP